MKRTLIAIIITALLTAAAVTIAQPCQTEDGTNCTWYASAQGNGQGTSFVNISGLVVYLP